MYRRHLLFEGTQFLNFREFEDVERWCAENGGEPALSALLARHRIDVDSSAVAKAWLEHRAKTAEATRAEQELSLTERSTKAAEHAAEAARQSAIWARCAAIIAVAALAISAWPYIAERLR
jgi:hypothetical protein